jgi:hypothetical protein
MSHLIIIYRSARVSEDPRMEKITAILDTAKKGQKEAVEYSKVAKMDLVQEVRQLYRFLQEAKRERLQQDIDIIEWETSLSSAIRDNEQGSRKFEMDRNIYARMIKEDRDTYTRKMEEVEDGIAGMHKERQEAIEWAKGKQALYLSETQKLQDQLHSAKATAVQRALDYNQVLAQEIQDLEAEVATGATVDGTSAAQGQRVLGLMGGGSAVAAADDGTSAAQGQRVLGLMGGGGAAAADDGGATQGQRVLGLMGGGGVKKSRPGPPK